MSASPRLQSMQHILNVTWGLITELNTGHQDDNQLSSHYDYCNGLDIWNNAVYLRRDGPFFSQEITCSQLSWSLLCDFVARLHTRMLYTSNVNRYAFALDVIKTYMSKLIYVETHTHLFSAQSNLFSCSAVKKSVSMHTANLTLFKHFPSQS